MDKEKSGEFLNVKDVALELDITERKARELMSSGEIKSKKVAGKYITTKDILKKYIEE
ncbi:MAG: helix-turn-helix domain-containing protein [Syntrophothermus sp.]